MYGEIKRNHLMGGGKVFVGMEWDGLALVGYKVRLYNTYKFIDLLIIQSILSPHLHSNPTSF